MISSLLEKLMPHRPGDAAAGQGTAASRWYLLLPLLLLALSIIGLTAIAVVRTVMTQESKEVVRLQAIAELKARQLGDWLEERRGEARFLHDNQYWGETYQRWHDGGDTRSRDLLFRRLAEFLGQDNFRDVLLFDSRGIPLWSAVGEPLTLGPPLGGVIPLVDDHGEVRHLGPYRDAEGNLRLDFITRMQGAGRGTGPIVVLRTDPTDYLSKAFQAWPVPDTTGEILLFRRDGDEILHINELRYWNDRSSQLRMPVSHAKLLAAQVLNGNVSESGLVKGLDYRKVLVTGVVRPVSGTDWFLIAKLDQAEISADAFRSALWIVLAGFLALLVTAAGSFLFYLRQKLSTALGEADAQAEKLRALELLDTLVGNSTDAIFVKDKQGRYLFINQATTSLSGKSEAEILGRDDRAILAPDDAAKIMADDRKVMTENRIIPIEEELMTPEGPSTFLTTKGPIHDAEGRIVGVFGIARDITLRKQAEEQIRQLSLAVEQSPVSIVITDLEANIQYLNQAFVLNTGYSREEALGRNMSLLKSGNTPPETYANLWNTLSLGCPWKGELRNRRKSGEEYVDFAVIAPLRQPDGRISHYIGVQEDITEKRHLADELARHTRELQESNRALRAESEMRSQTEAELRRSNAELKQIAYVTSHDLQEPLRTVASFVQLLARRNRGRLDDDSDQFIDFAVDGVVRMQTIIQDILEFSQAGETDEAPAQATDAAAACHEAVANLGAAMAAAEARVTCGPLPAVAVAHRRLVQVFQHLIGNSLKFHGNEPPAIQVSAAQDGQYWRFCVGDNGIGIDPRYHEKIFVIFQRLHHRTDYQGTGIGLALCKKIVECHGGSIWVESAEGQGASFYFTLPAATPQ